MVSSKAVPENLNLKLRSKFNHGFTNHGCMRCAFLEVLYSFKEKRADKARYFFFKIFKMRFFEILKMFKNSMKFLRATC